jgi:hypothetical protein
LAAWEYAGLLTSYWCNARCAFCSVRAGPEHREWMSPELAVRCWAGLAEVARDAGKPVRIHLTGGEPFGNWDNLLAIASAAHHAGLTGGGAFEKVETNAYWADDDGLIRERLKALDACGMRMLHVSSDVFHQEHVPFERVRRCVEVARAVLGENRVRVRWWDFHHDPIEVHRLSRAERAQAFRAAMVRRRDRLTGRAADELADLLPGRPAEDFDGQHCTKAILRSRHVHVDPSGYVFPGVCTGIILGNASTEPIPAMWRRLSQKWRADPVLSELVSVGPMGLLGRARAMGYEPPDGGYAGKCHLCTHVRGFLFEHGQFPERLGPSQMYPGPSRDGKPVSVQLGRSRPDQTDIN